jgi:hypothetical protein
MFFSTFEYHMFYALYPFVTYLLTAPHNIHSYGSRIIVPFIESEASLLCSQQPDCPGPYAAFRNMLDYNHLPAATQFTH